MLKTGILFDLDGTLLDTLEDLQDSVNYALAQYGCPPRTLTEVKEFIGNGARKLIERSLPGKENDPDVDEVLATYQAYYKTHSRIKTKPYDGILQALKEISAKYPIAIVSNKPDAATKALCKDFFGDVYARGESNDCPRKPAPDMLQKAMEIIGVDTCIYVGDSEPDVQTARNLGVKCLSVLWGFRDRKTLEQAGGEYFCDHPAKLLQMLEQML
ncbi:MAG: HAD family hydrolase [Oscillospiraceae bacterium]|nr:HAD family hydrolase [Oscillospiraceae bacterium]